MDEKPKVTLTDGSPVTPDHKDIDPRTGQQKGYVVLSVEERAKGFVQPVRTRYRHVGRPGPKYPTRDLTPEEVERWKGGGFVKFEMYPSYPSAPVGRYWTQEELNRVDAGCGQVTFMGRALAETYAANPRFYGGTFCATCGAHFPVGEDGEFVWVDNEPQRVGT